MVSSWPLPSSWCITIIINGKRQVIKDKIQKQNIFLVINYYKLDKNESWRACIYNNVFIPISMHVCIHYISLYKILQQWHVVTWRCEYILCKGTTFVEIVTSRIRLARNICKDKVNFPETCCCPWWLSWSRGQLPWPLVVEQHYQLDDACPKSYQRTCKYQGIPGSGHTHAHSPLCAALDEGHAPVQCIPKHNKNKQLKNSARETRQTCFPIGSGLVTVVEKKPSHSRRP